jgi:CheY-like chemotaxis protein
VNPTITKILYADDDSDDRFFLSESFDATDIGADLVYASNGDEAINYLESANDLLPALIVLDLNMPKRDGKQTLSYLKSHPRFASIPVVILSTSESKADKESCANLGAISYFKKPIHYNGYVEIVKSFKPFVQAQS